MPFKRFVETGRIAYIADGPYKGKLCTIVDVIDQTRVLVDGPETGVKRGAIRLNQIYLTKFRIKFPFTAGTKTVRKVWSENKIDEKWKETAWAKKIEAKKKRSEMTDFDRFWYRYNYQIRRKAQMKVFFDLRAARKREVRMLKKARELGLKLDKAARKHIRVLAAKSRTLTPQERQQALQPKKKGKAADEKKTAE